jgi:GNAT superfamily N-acetyltransferase
MNDTTFRIRELGTDDLDTVMASGLWPASRHKTLRQWASGLVSCPRCVCIGLFDSGVLAAFVLSELCAGGNGLVWAAWTREESRGRGVATFLVAEAERRLKGMGAVDAMAFCNAKSAPVMARLGYHSHDQYTEMMRDL